MKAITVLWIFFTVALIGLISASIIAYDDTEYTNPELVIGAKLLHSSHYYSWGHLEYSTQWLIDDQVITIHSRDKEYTPTFAVSTTKIFGAIRYHTIPDNVQDFKGYVINVADHINPRYIDELKDTRFGY